VGVSQILLASDDPVYEHHTRAKDYCKLTAWLLTISYNMINIILINNTHQNAKSETLYNFITYNYITVYNWENFKF